MSFSVCPLFSQRSHCISQILESVNHIHQHDIVHRDLKVSGCPLPWQPHTQMRAHTPLFVAMATHRWLSVALSLCISASIPFIFPLRLSLSHLLFVPSIPLNCAQICQPVCPWPQLCVYMRACVFMRSTEMVSHGHVEGFVSHQWQGNDKDSNSAYVHAHTCTLCTFVKGGVYYQRGGEGIGEPQELPRQPMWHHTTHGAAGEGLAMSQLADRLKCKE